MPKKKISKRLVRSSKASPKKKATKGGSRLKAAATKAKPFSLDDLKPVKLKKGVKLIADSSSENLRNIEKVKAALVECLFTNDPEAFKEILKGHLDAISMTELSRTTKIPRRTLYRLTEPDSNPTLDTLSKVLSELVA